MAQESYHAFEPRPGELARDILLHHGQRSILPGDGAAPYRVIDVLSMGLEFAGTRDQCIDFVERAWWRAETASTSDGYVRAADHAARLGFERPAQAGVGWEGDPHLTSALSALHSF